MNQKDTIISVIMPVHNSEAFLAEAIESILVQSYSYFEFLIVDDGSTDGSRKIISDNARKDRRISPIFIDHKGVVAAMNEGVRYARGQWIARMDQDDIALSNRLSTQLKWAIEKDLDVCGGQAEIFGATEKKLLFPEKHESICQELLFRCPMLYPASIIRRDVFLKNLVTNNCVFDDYELFTRLACRYRLGNAPFIVLRYRAHEGQVSKVKKKEIQKDFQKYRFRYFYKMFPNTPLNDYLTLARISDKQSFDDIQQLDRAGQWLVKLADYPDDELKKKMSKRWKETCDRSAALGDACRVIFERYASQIIDHTCMKMTTD